MTERLVLDAAGRGEQVTFDAGNGSPGLHQRIVRLGPGTSGERDPGRCEELLFVVAGSGTLELGGDRYRLAAGTAAYLRPGERYAVEVDDGQVLEVVSVLVTDPPSASGAGREVTVTLAGQEARAATADRAFRLLVGPEVGCASVTQFVGEIPPGRAPDHFHTYDEVLYVLRGNGVLHVDGRDEAVGPGACVHLSPRLVHALENAGDTPLELVAVFRPAGSPAEAYYPDSTRA